MTLWIMFSANKMYNRETGQVNNEYNANVHMLDKNESLSETFTDHGMKVFMGKCPIMMVLVYSNWPLNLSEFALEIKAMCDAIIWMVIFRMKICV